LVKLTAGIVAATGCIVIRITPSLYVMAVRPERGQESTERIDWYRRISH
jgi:hypothetical protein